VKLAHSEKIHFTNVSDDDVFKLSSVKAEIFELLDDCYNHHRIAYQGIIHFSFCTLALEWYQNR